MVRPEKTTLREERLPEMRPFEGVSEEGISGKEEKQSLVRWGEKWLAVELTGQESRRVKDNRNI